ncbi:SLBB domain-containing protein [Gemmatimonas aurantiaca]|nr:SLBB domain-containing protein [Gemmatimonas aurantiaca]
MRLMKEIPLTNRRFSAYLALAFGLILLLCQSLSASLVDPLRYIVGPGDEFTIEFFESKTASIQAIVSPEGMISIPNVGSFILDGETLYSAKAILREGLKKRFSGASATISLSQVRKQRILVSGAVENPGLYESLATDLVSEAIELAGGLTKAASRRNIVIRGVNGDTPVDMDLFARAGVMSANPPLYLGDVVYVPVMSDSALGHYISGAVNTPGWVEYTGRDRVKDLLALVGGLKIGAISDSLLLVSSQDKLSDENSKQNVTITEDYENVLKPATRLVALRSANRDLVDFTISGAVYAPGRYELLEGTTLADAIATAGGYSFEADIAGVAVFNGRSATPSDSLSEVAGSYLSGVSNQAQLVKVGDSIFVPKRVGYIGVFGQVTNPGMVTYHAGWNAGQYLNAVGGVASLSDLHTSIVVRRATSAQIPFHLGADVFDGDVIHIFRKTGDAQRSALSYIRDLALLGAGVALTVYSIDQMGK